MILKFSDEAILQGLRDRESSFISYFYKEFFPQVRWIVERNSGNEADAEDVFQDGMLVLYHRLSYGDLRLNCALKTYFYAVCQKIWYKRLERKHRLLYQSDTFAEDILASYSTQETDFSEEELAKTRLFMKHFFSLPEDCQRLLRLFCEKKTFREIAQIMNFKDEGYVKTRKYLCKNMLRKRIMKDPEYKQYIAYE
jgi:RNA polymerase sigma factor (sigma-70 family)